MSNVGQRWIANVSNEARRAAAVKELVSSATLLAGRIAELQRYIDVSHDLRESDSEDYRVAMKCLEALVPFGALEDSRVSAVVRKRLRERCQVSPEIIVRARVRAQREEDLQGERDDLQGVIADLLGRAGYLRDANDILELSVKLTLETSSEKMSP